jgi:hypothetical protein
MMDEEYRKSHEDFLNRLNSLDRQYVADSPESIEEAKWLEERMKQINNNDNEQFI